MSRKRRNDLVDITGRRFGKLVALRLAECKRPTKWVCLCDCGNIKEIRASSLKAGFTRSCGCLRKENMFIKTRLYHIWTGMKNRSHHKTAKSTDYYDKGITLCDEWSEFINFREWALTNGYNDTLSIDRIDNSKGYSPENCRWATPLEQANNRRTCVYVTLDNKTQTVSQWCREKHIKTYDVFNYVRVNKVSHKDALLHFINNNNNGTQI